MNNFIINLKKKLFPSLFFLIISSWVIVVNGAGGEAGSALPCIQELLPCQPYLLAPLNPPATCCMPLRDIITDEKECICKVFKNPEIMKSLNVTLEQALKLPKACGINNADASLCNNNGNLSSISSYIISYYLIDFGLHGFDEFLSSTYCLVLHHSF